MEVEHCVAGDEQEIRNFLHRIKKIVEKGWPVDMEGIAEGDRPAERQAQGRQRRQRYSPMTSSKVPTTKRPGILDGESQRNME